MTSRPVNEDGMELKLEQVEAGDRDALLGLLRRPIPAAVQTFPDFRQQLVDQVEGLLADVQDEREPLVQRRTVSGRSDPNKSLLGPTHDAC